MVVKLRSAVGVATIWLATVAGVSVTASVAIDRAGRDLIGGVVSSLPSVTLGSAVSTTTPDGGPQRTDVTAEPSGTSEPSATAKPSATSKPSATAKPSATSKPPAASEPSATPEPSSSLRDRTFSIDGGQVSVRCTGSTIRLRIAQPDDGWRVEVEKAGPEEVHVTFRRGDIESGGGSDVTAVCAAGTPAFTVETDH